MKRCPGCGEVLPRVPCGWRLLRFSAAGLFVAALLGVPAFMFVFSQATEATELAPHVGVAASLAMAAAGPLWLLGYIGGQSALRFRVRRLRRRREAPHVPADALNAGDPPWVRAPGPTSLSE
jgi:hypothetical protein